MSLEEYTAREKVALGLRQQLFTSLDLTHNPDKTIKTAALRPSAMYFYLRRDAERASSTAAPADDFPTFANIYAIPLDRQQANFEQITSIGYLSKKPFKMALFGLTSGLSDVSPTHGSPLSYVLDPASGVAIQSSRRIKVSDGEVTLIGNGAAGEVFQCNHAVVSCSFVDSATDFLQSWADAAPTSATFNPDALDDPDAYPEPAFRIHQQIGNLIKAINTSSPLAGTNIKVVVDDLTQPVVLRQCGVVQVGVMPPEMKDPAGIYDLRIDNDKTSADLPFEGANARPFAASMVSVTVPVVVVCGMNYADGAGACSKWVTRALDAICSGIQGQQLTLTRPHGDYGWLGVTISANMMTSQVEGRPDIIFAKIDINVLAPYLIGYGSGSGSEEPDWLECTGTCLDFGFAWVVSSFGV